MLAGVRRCSCAQDIRVHVDSPHWDDQAQKLFSLGRAKDTFFMDRERLMPHVTRTSELVFEAATE